jgi:pantetheine-phosphate adenylyltransferase
MKKLLRQKIMQQSKLIAVYPGSFDPITYGHMDIINKAAEVVDELIIAVANNSSKLHTFSVQERFDMVLAEVGKMEGMQHKIKVTSFDGLLVEFVAAQSAKVIIRGLRAVSDFDYEFQMACVNSKLKPEVQTIFIPASEKTHFISSRLVKEVVRLGGDVKEFVSSDVYAKLHNLK